jgi:hypothetical protein
LEYYEELSQLCRLQILNRSIVRNPGTNSIFESLMNL